MKKNGEICKTKGGILLNVGCRAGKEVNWVGIDNTSRIGVDIVHDLESFPYPLDDGSCITIAAAHVVEHIEPKKFFQWMDEMWRILRPEGQLAISAPYAGSHGYFQDPTHVTPINESTFQLLDPTFPLYMQYSPKPWKIEHCTWSHGGNIEAILKKRILSTDKMDELACASIQMCGAIQKVVELAHLYRLIRDRMPRTVIEIGTANGGVLFGICQLAANDATIISVDLPGGNFGGGYSVEQQKAFRRYAKKDQKMHFIRDDSHLPRTLSRVKEALSGKMVDFLFIDGDHTYEGVKQDWEMYSPLVRKGGVVAFHDILFHPRHPECKVDRFWKEVKKGKKTMEYVDTEDATWGGIGVVLK